ncbi:MAG: sulfite exporter TauE/SafE family protein [Chitinophagaceae bacterium]|nr:sulfite exporter TauE/SafE family protein [Chitinophagaceae bacterium]MCB9045427.1 sulfite exporter TauE/SafE family protein [Chitinophagales bacterium]
MDATLILFLLLSLLAEILGTIGGFGSSVYFVPLANLFLDFKSVLGITAIFHLSSNISKMVLFKKGLNRFLLVYIGVPAVIMVITGGILSKYMDETVLQVSFAIFIIVTSLFFLWFDMYVLLADKKNAIIGGSLSGFLAGVLGTGGAIRGITMVAFNIEKEQFVATSAAIDFAVDFSRTVVYFFNGYMHAEHLKYMMSLIVVGFVGTWLGKLALQRISQERFKTIVLLLLLGIGIFSLTRALLQSQ